MTSLALAAWLVAAHAERPTEGGLWAYAAEGEVRSWAPPEGGLRVTYSASGPSAVPDDDADADDVPDYVAEVAAIAAEALARFDEAGFAAPVSEAEAGVEGLGGDDRLDVYLVDFGGASDGSFVVDACVGSPSRCAGALIVENDFAGYGYASRTEALDTVVSHELFHAVQAAYGELPVWASEGTAVWAERLFRPESRDFLRLCDGYLRDPGRPIDRPPGGPVPAFAYGSALWWDFLATRHDAGVIVDVLVAAAGRDDVLGAVDEVLVARADALSDAWWTFAQWNAATGTRGGRYGHAYGSDLAAVELGAAPGGETERLFPIAASYWSVVHAGGVPVVGLDPTDARVRLALMALDGGVVTGAAVTWRGGETPPAVDGGRYVLVASVAEQADASVSTAVCWRDACEVAVDTDQGDRTGCAVGGTRRLGLLGAVLVLARRRRVSC